MIDNFLEGDYHSYDQVYLNSDTNTSLFIGDVQAALDLAFLQANNIKTGMYRKIKSLLRPRIWIRLPTI